MEIKLSFLKTGYCTHPEALVNPGKKSRFLSIIRSPSTVGVIEHPEAGVILFDTGYARRNYAVTKTFPERLYATILPMHIEHSDSAVEQLAFRGIYHKDVSKIILSHFHADHIGGLKDFPNAEIIYQQEAYAKLKKMGRFGSLINGFLPKLLPDTFIERSSLLQLSKLKHYVEPLMGFDLGWDILGDQSLIAIPLEGHAAGQIGLFVRSEGGKFFLIADAAWASESIVTNQLPSWLTRLVMHDFKKYAATLNKLHLLSQSQQQLKIIPCHCGQIHK